MNDTPTIASVHEALQDSLDALVSARSSTSTRSRALETLERLTTQTFAAPEGSATLREFLSLQNTFECNVASRTMPWISGASLRLDSLLQRGLSDGQRQAEASILTSQLTRALFIIQGVALTHHSTKVFLGRRYPLDVLLDLLVISRHLASPSHNPKQPAASDEVHPHSKQVAPPSALPNAVLDTLLCILVDSSPSLRVFEECNGVQTIVKLLKRAHTPRDVRMKCLEFLYFYLMDETSPRSDLSGAAFETSHLLAAPLSPSPFIDTPIKFQYFAQSGRNASSGSEDSFTSSDSLRSSSSSSSSTTSLSSSSTTSKTPPSPTKPSSTHSFTRPRSLLMLQREVDFVPATPKKSHVSRLSVDPLRPLSMPNSPFKNFRAVPDGNDKLNPASFHEGDGAAVGGEQNIAFSKLGNRDTVKTTEQKKEFLGMMLGNVDALVEGVKRAGVWGLA
ncbi:CDC14-domain-containing protein [Lactarius psammicola]|nr:CDC14-domain-containing protein [Lactarius psammicola]